MEWLKRMAYRGYKLGVVDVAIHGAIKLFGARSWDTPSRWLMERFLPAMALSGWTFTDDSERMLTIHHDLYRHVEMEMFVPAATCARPSTSCARSRTPLPPAACATVTCPLTIQALLEQVPGTMAELEWSGGYLNHYFITCRRVHPDEALIAMSSGGEGDYYSISVITYRLGDPRFARYCRVLALCLASPLRRPPALGQALSR